MTEAFGLRVGDRIRLISMFDDPDPLAPGDTGTVDWINDSNNYPQIGVVWDSGRHLMLIPGVDEYERVQVQQGQV